MAKQSSVAEPETKAPKKEPLIAVQIWNKDIKEGSDFHFTFRRPAKMKNGKVIERYPMERIRLISGAKHELAPYIVEHLEKLAYDELEYVEDAPEGESMQVSHKRYRFAINRLPTE